MPFWAFIVLLPLAALGLGWIGLQRWPQSFAPYPDETPPLDFIDLPDDLPAPVARYYRATVGERLPVITSAVISGRAWMRFGPVAMKGRYRFIHEAGQNYRHYIEACWFGIPIMRVNERYLDGVSRMELPFGVTEGEPNINQAANLGLWAESIWLPSVFITDDRARWEAVDETTATLIVPFADGEERFTVRFDAATGLLVSLEAMRFKEAGDEQKIRWLNEVGGWTTLNGIQIPSPGIVTWEDDGTPWARFRVEEVVYNADVSQYARARGL